MVFGAHTMPIQWGEAMRVGFIQSLFVPVVTLVCACSDHVDPVATEADAGDVQLDFPSTGEVSADADAGDGIACGTPTHSDNCAEVDFRTRPFRRQPVKARH